MNKEPGTIVRIWRKLRELNQSDAAAMAGISTRHQSFIENGRTKASASTLRSIAAALHMPENDKNKLLLAAGFAPEERARHVSDLELDRAREVIAIELEICGGVPGFAADECWGVIDQNRAYSDLIHPLIASGELPRHDQSNFAHLVFHPSGLRKVMANWHNFSAFFMLMLREESIDKPAGHEFHKMVSRVHPWSEDQDGADILEPYALSAIAMPVIIALPAEAPRKMRFATFHFAAPSSSPAASIRIGKFLPWAGE